MDHKNKGVLFTNDKGDNEKRPGYKGRGNWKGQEFEVAAWNRTSKDGKPYLSLSFSEPYKKDEPLAEIDEDISNEDLLKTIPF
jgi:uncharacterized protein (DUF736 family)